MLVTMFFGGADALGKSGGVAHAPAPEAVVAPALDALEANVPGLKAAFTGSAWLDSWADNEYSHGAWTSFRTGQSTRFGRVAGAPEGGAFFAGEHTSIKTRGLMNGAVESGERAAQQALDHLS
jgi:monoamine oxidase